jgi:hypothetical protein
MPTITLTRTQTRTATASSTRTATLTHTTTPTLTHTEPPTPTHTHTPTYTPSETTAPSDTPTPTQTFTPSDTPTASNTVPSPTPTDTPIPTATPVCSLVTAGATLDNPSGLNTLTVDITNNCGATITISSMQVVWDTIVAAKFNFVYLGLPADMTTRIANPNDSASPSNFPSPDPFAGLITSRQIANGSTLTLTLEFQNNLSSDLGYSVSVTFDNGCSVSASR